MVAMPVVVIAAIAGALVAWGRWRRGDSRSQVLRWLGLWLVLLAMSTDPTVGGSTVQMVGTNADVLFVVDTTGSIAAEDYNGREPRLNGVRADIVEIAKSFPGARYSLITFDSDAALELPWTTDLGALTSLVDVLDQERTAFSHGSRLDVATKTIDDALDRSAKAPSRLPLVFFFSDGEQTDKRSFTFASIGRKTAGGAVLGYGTTDGGRMRDYWGYDSRVGDGGYIYDYATREDAISRIDEGNLQQIAQQLNVPYAHRTKPGGLGQLTQTATATQRTSAASTGARRGEHHVAWMLGLVVVALAGWQVVATMQAAFEARRLLGTSNG